MFNICYVDRIWVERFRLACFLLFNNASCVQAVREFCMGGTASEKSWNQWLNQCMYNGCRPGT